MKKLLIALAIFSTNLPAEPYLVSSPSGTASLYTPVVVTPKKLKTTLTNAKAQFPGEEYIVQADTNAPLNHDPVVFNGLWTYNNISSLFYGFSRAPKVDGLKATGMANFIVTQTFLSPTYPVNISFTGPSKEFGAYLGTTNMAGGIFTDAVTVAVDGITLGTVSLPAFQSTFVGVHDEDGLGQVTFTPSMNGNFDSVAPFVADSFYLE